jgi:hypothetical protein
MVGPDEVAAGARGFSPEQLDALELEYEEIFRLRSQRDENPRFWWELVFRGLRGDREYKMLRAHAHRDDRKASAQEDFARSIVIAVWFQGEAAVKPADARKLLEKVMHRRPGVLDSEAATKLFKKMVGEGEEEFEKP